MKKIFKILNNKSTKIIFINILIIVFLLIIAEISAFIIEMNVLVKEGAFDNKTTIQKISEMFKYYYKTISNYNEEPCNKYLLREPIINDNFKKNLVILGCSFAYGHQLKTKETLQYKLANQAKYNVYNLAMSSTGLRTTLWTLRNKELLQEYMGGRKKLNILYMYSLATIIEG